MVSPASLPSPAPERGSCVSDVEAILNYEFKNPKLLEQALTHSSVPDAPSYERLEFFGDRVLNLVVSDHLFWAYPDLKQGKLTKLLWANVSTEKLARVAVHRGLYQFLRDKMQYSDDQVSEFAGAVKKEDGAVAHGGLVKAPKFLADIVESVAAAIYIDAGSDLKKFWKIFKGLLEPIVGPKELQQQPQPITMLYEVYQKQGKDVEITQEKIDSTCIARVWVDGKVVALGTSEHKVIARINAARRCLSQHPQPEPVNHRFDGPLEIKDAKQKLHELCAKNKWPKPDYRTEESGPLHSKEYACTVVVKSDVVHTEVGKKRSSKKEARRYAAYRMLLALKPI